jgi:hypothetical protein
MLGGGTRVNFSLFQQQGRFAADRLGRMDPLGMMLGSVASTRLRSDIGCRTSRTPSRIHFD